MERVAPGGVCGLPGQARLDPKRAVRSRSSRQSTRRIGSLLLSQSDVDHHLAG